MREAAPLLSLELLERVHSYEGIARELGVDRADARLAVHEVVAQLVADREPPPPEHIRGQIIDYLLREQTLPERMLTREQLDRSPGDRAWATELRLSLGFVIHRRLPLIPDPESDLDTSEQKPTSAPGPPALTLAGDRAGRRGTVLPRRVYLIRRLVALGVLGLVIAAAVTAALILTHSSSPARHRPSGPRTTLERLTLTAVGNQPHATGLGAVVRQGDTLLLLVQGKHLQPNDHNYYAVWLYNARDDAELLGLVSPGVGSKGVFSSGTTLPDDAVRFHALVVTRESSPSPTRPGPRILSSPLSVQ